MVNESDCKLSANPITLALVKRDISPSKTVKFLLRNIPVCHQCFFSKYSTQLSRIFQDIEFITLQLLLKQQLYLPLILEPS